MGNTSIIHYQLTPGKMFQRHALCGRIYLDPNGERFTRLTDKVTCQSCVRELGQRQRRQVAVGVTK